MKKILVFVVIAIVFIIAFNTHKKPDPSTSASTDPAPSATAFRILAGSELKDVADLVTAFGKTQNMEVVF
ncbi:MAG: hypothetical protein V4805_11740, partial [Pseudomonadota bacterium]